MSFDGQVLVIAFFAVALKLYLWSREAYVVRVDVEPARKECCTSMTAGSDSGRKRGQTEPRA